MTEAITKSITKFIEKQCKDLFLIPENLLQYNLQENEEDEENIDVSPGLK